MRPSSAFGRAVAWLRKHKKTVTAVESSCGGLISSGIMAVPGSSAVYFGGSVSYNTKKARKLLLDDEEMHSALVAGVEPIEGETEADTYIRSKHEWTARTAVAFCEALQTDYALAEGGAVGPTFRKEGLTTGFTVLCIAGRATPHEEVTVLAQRLVRSAHADREGNMRAFADEAAAFLCETIGAAAAEAEADAAPAVPPSGLALDRDSGARTNASKVAEHLASPFARFVLCRGGQVLLREGGGAAEGESGGKLALLSRAAAQLPEGEARDSSRLSYLGQLSGLEEAAGAEAAGAEAGGAAGGDASSTPVFAVDVPAEEAPPLSGAEYADTRLASARLRGAEAALALYAHGLLTWQRRSAFCARCGGANGLAHAGHARQCQACGALSFPRQDPAIIVTVQSADGKSLLLARSSRHPPRLVRSERGLEPLPRVATPPFQPQSRRLTRPRRRSPLLLSSSHY